MSKLFKYFGTTLEKGQYLFREGDRADSLYLIHRGRVKISKIMGNVEKHIQILEEGEFVGEMAIINSLPRSADAMALEECQLIKMNRESFTTTIQKNRQFALAFIQFLSQRLRDTTDQLAHYSELSRREIAYNMVLEDMISKGKVDNSEKWLLLNLPSFLVRYNEAFHTTDREVLAILKILAKERKITLKEDTKGREWIAMAISR